MLFPFLFKNLTRLPPCQFCFAKLRGHPNVRMYTLCFLFITRWLY